ncbi:MAG: outer membrane beta-barrel protein [candidate division Zixibacteria bacterium]|nr:outer membrane beta-barrel protein [candidate division Zixibacteria bacterium]
MKKILLTLIVLIGFALSANAQVPTPFSFYAGGALSMPASPEGFDAGWKTGWHGMLGAGYKVMPSFQVMGKAEYHTFGLESSDMGGIEGGDYKVLMFGADGRFNINMPAAPVAPFVFGGVGLANMKLSEFTGPSGTELATALLNATSPEDQNKMYYNVGAGFELKTGPSLKLFAQVRYVGIQTEGDAMAFIPITLGLRFF